MALASSAWEPRQLVTLPASLWLFFGCCRFKWDVIKSILKSAAGWQARKLAELQIPSYGEDRSLDVLSGKKSGLKGILKGLQRRSKQKVRVCRKRGRVCSQGGLGRV